MAEPKVTLQAAHVSAGSNLPIKRIVVHATCPVLGFPRASAAGQARNTARYFTSTDSGGSAHYVEDVAGEEHCVRDSAVAWHAPPNPHSIGVEICADGGSAAAYRKNLSANYTRAQWLSPEVWPAVQRAARRVRELCDRFNVPKVQLTVAEVRADRPGICGHVDVSEAFGMTDHSDPGPNFPWVEFMQEVIGTQEDIVTPDDIKAIADEVLKRPVKDLNGNTLTVGQAIGITLRNTGYIAQLEKASVDKIASAVAARVGYGASAADIAKELLVQLAQKETP